MSDGTNKTEEEAREEGKGRRAEKIGEAKAAAGAESREGVPEERITRAEAVSVRRLERCVQICSEIGGTRTGRQRLWSTRRRRRRSRVGEGTPPRLHTDLRR